MTATNAVVLLVLLAAEGATILFVRQLFAAHVFIGMLLIPPVALKLASTGWRFARYYPRDAEYVRRGPPQPSAAPARAADRRLDDRAIRHRRRARPRRTPSVASSSALHKASFVVWFGALSAHVLGHVLKLPAPVRSDVRSELPGARLRRHVIAGAIVLGLILGIAGLPAAHDWSDWAAQHHHHEGRSRARGRVPSRWQLSRRGAAHMRRRASTSTPATTTTRPASIRPQTTRHLPSNPARRLLRLPSVPRGPVPGYVLIADRNNDRLLIVSPAKHVVWSFPRPGDVRPGQSFHDPDDAFFTPGYRAISVNEEFNETAGLVDVRRHRIIWTYGHAAVAGSSFGYLSHPDDAYLLPNGLLMVADIENCRVLFVNHAKQVVREIGHAGSCGHDPPSGLSSPNGATPLGDGGVLVTEIGGWVDRIAASGRLVYTVRTPTTYPSDAQLLPNGNILVAGFNTPGRIDELTPQGRILWTYAPQSGPGALDRPSLAVRWPNGMVAVTDDWHHRVVVIDPRTKKIVWSYGHDATPGTGPGYLDKPDGLDLLPAGRTIGTVTASRLRAQHTRPSLRVRRIGTLPAAISRASAVALPDGRIVVAGGLVNGSSTDRVLDRPAGSLVRHRPSAHRRA